MLSFERMTSQQIVTLSSSRDSNDATYGRLLAQKQKQDLLGNVLTSHRSKTKGCIKILFDKTHQRKSESLKCDMIFNIEFNKTSHLYTCLRLKVKPKTSKREYGRKKHLKSHFISTQGLHFSSRKKIIHIYAKFML